MISCGAFFNGHTVNVFTDASVKNHGKVTESIPGAVTVLGANETINERYVRLIPSTNNEGEIYAIYMGILECIRARNTWSVFDTFNIFSDSKISVYGLREWYQGWIVNSVNTDRLINSSGKEVKNQEIFIKCFDTILDSGIHINIYHIRGHIDLNKESEYDKFVNDFMQSNNIEDCPSRDLVQMLVHFNDRVDTGSRNLLLPNGRDIPTITAIHKDIPFTSFEGLPIKSEYLFTHDKMRITNEKKRYASLISCNTF